MAYVLSDYMKIIDLGWPWRSILAIVVKRCETRPRLLLITNRKLHTPFQMRWKSSTLNDREVTDNHTVSYPSDSWASCSKSGAWLLKQSIQCWWQSRSWS